MNAERLIELLEALPYEGQDAKIVFRNEGIGLTEVTDVLYDVVNNIVEIV